MKILLVVPPSTLWPIERPHVVVPLGIGYIAGMLEKAGHNVKVLDTIALGWKEYLSGWKTKKIDTGQSIHFGLSWEGIERHIRNESPDVIGISSSYTCQSENAYKVADIAKKVDSGVKVITGGAHPTAFPEDVLKNRNIDIVVLGEGENTIVDLVQKIENGSKLSGVNGIAYKERKTIKTNQRREFIEDLDSIPFPARHLLPMKEYFEAKSTHGGEGKWSPITSMITSRGCPGICVFCSIHSIWGRKWRARSAKNVVDEIEQLVEKYAIKELHFEDDNLTLNKKRMMEICNGMIERGLNEKVRWTTPNSVMVATLDEEVLKKMKESGCYALSFGVESGDENILKNIIRKNVPFDRLKDVIKVCKKLKIETTCSFILGLPGENKETFRKTIDFAKNSGLDKASFLAATPFPGTALYELCKTRGYIPKNMNWSDFRTIGSAVITTEEFTKEDVLKWQKIGYKEFYSRPGLMLRAAINHAKSPRSLWKLAARYKKFISE